MIFFGKVSEAASELKSYEATLWKYLENNTEFIIDREIEDKLLITVAPDGYLKRK